MRSGWQPVLMIMMTAVLAVGCSSEPAARVPPPDTPPPATVPMVSPTPSPSETPAATAPSAISLQFGAEPFVHPSGLFEFHPPLGWSIDWDSASARMHHPDGLASLSIQVTNTGATLEEEEFERFVSARNDNLYAGMAEFELLGSDVDAEAMRAQVTDSFLSDQGPVTLTSVYRGMGEGIFALDFWSSSGLFESYWRQIMPILTDIQLDGDPAGALPPYAWVYEYFDPQGRFRLDVPAGWQREATHADFTVIQRFRSPDLRASIDVVLYDDGQTRSKPEAALIVQTLLDLHYASDVRIVGDEIQPDGSERLTWISPAESIHGRVYFEIRDSLLVIQVVQSPDEGADLYADALQQAVASFSKPN